MGCRLEGHGLGTVEVAVVGPCLGALGQVGRVVVIVVGVAAVVVEPVLYVLCHGQYVGMVAGLA